MSGVDLDTAPAPPTRRAPRPGPRAVVRVLGSDLRSTYGFGTALVLLALVLSPPAGGQVALGVAAAVGLVVPTLRRRWWFWLAVAAVVVGYAVDAEPVSQWDNHRFLQAYLALMLAGASLGPDLERHARTAARLLLAGVFLFAAAWKLATPAFVDGSFFVYTASADPRFGVVAETVGLQDPGTTDANRAAARAWGRPAADVEPVPLTVPRGVEAVAQPVAIATIALEVAVGLAFLLPPRRLRRWWPDAALLVFVVATYPLAPVVGFGYALLALGAVRSTLPPWPRTLLYLGAFGFLHALLHRDTLLELVVAVG